MEIEVLLLKAEENYKTAEWAEKKSYYDVAVSRYYYSVYEKVIYISKKERFYKKSNEGENSHYTFIETFIKNLDTRLDAEEKLTLLMLKKLREKRNISDYDEYRIDNNTFMLDFKYHFKRVDDIVNKYI